VPHPADVTLVMHAARLGISEADFDGLLQKFDEIKIEQAMVAIEQSWESPLITQLVLDT